MICMIELQVASAFLLMLISINMIFLGRRKEITIVFKVGWVVFIVSDIILLILICTIYISGFT